ncbi:MAG TPA: GntG family PLP-dependent aldolase [Miltoncostaeaceae bacterium]|nr:GntG family PLP-dependent aldolase [Miltoncostaeaceae bacterium]
MTRIDLRSDTVTLPTAAMRAAMADAPVGDDQFGEDPSVNRLQARVAELLGKEAALWLPSGTMANQVALRVLTRPGDDVVLPGESHVAWHETGAAAANAGVQFTEIGSRGTFTVDELVGAAKPRGHIVYPPTTLVVIENTHNRAGGVVFPEDALEAVTAEARALGLATYLDGARIWNAAVASGRPPADLADPFDLVGVAFSKGLGAPGGSMLAGSAETIATATRYRRMAGGAMRQAGFFAAAALHALEHHADRLAEDHANARLIAERLATSSLADVDLDLVQTNIVLIRLPDGAPDSAAVVAAAAERGVLTFPFGPRLVRLVTHLNVSREECGEAADLLVQAIDAAAAAP